MQSPCSQTERFTNNLHLMDFPSFKTFCSTLFLSFQISTINLADFPKFHHAHLGINFHTARGRDITHIQYELQSEKINVQDNTQNYGKNICPVL